MAGKLVARRLSGNPIIVPAMLPGDAGSNINGPSLIAAPDWLPNRLGAFYLYFAHHAGTSIRLAVADALEGPWRIHEPGTLQLADAPGCHDHIASPDMHVDAAGRRIVMYFHGPSVAVEQQLSFVATSVDGLHFTAGSEPIADFYLRVIAWRGGWLGMSKGGRMYRARDAMGPFEPLAEPAFRMSTREANAAGDVRHVALHLTGDDLDVYFTRIGDRPEQILRARIDLSQLEERWRAGAPEPVLAPELPWEGSTETLRASRSGVSRGRENALRDPAIFVHDSRTYMVYSIAGEAGLAIAELRKPEKRPGIWGVLSRALRK